MQFLCKKQASWGSVLDTGTPHEASMQNFIIIGPVLLMADTKSAKKFKQKIVKKNKLECILFSACKRIYIYGMCECGRNQSINNHTKNTTVRTAPELTSINSLKIRLNINYISQDYVGPSATVKRLLDNVGDDRWTTVTVNKKQRQSSCLNDDREKQGKLPHHLKRYIS